MRLRQTAMKLQHLPSFLDYSASEPDIEHTIQDQGFNWRILALGLLGACLLYTLFFKSSSLYEDAQEFADD
jgi:hypothetical protein